jgi:sensor histidine kinase YesM
MEVQIVTSETEVYFRIVNTKQIENQRDETHGIGIENVKIRLLLLYGSKHSLNIFDRENEYEVVLKLQL